MTYRNYTQLLSLLVLVVSMIHVSPVNADDLQIVRDRFVKAVVPTEPADVQMLQRVAHQMAQKQNADGSWPDVKYADLGRSNWLASKHLNNL